MTSHNDDDILLIVAGVSGVGKTTVAEFLASQLKGSRAYSNFVECEIAIKGATYHEADDFHSLENKKLMANGIPLDDERRASWLAAMRDAAKHADEKIVVLACSALKKKYRDVLRECGRKTIFVQLVADPEVLKERMEARKGHYMPVSLLSSQLNTQEEPTPDEQDVIQVDANGDREVVMDSTFKIVQARIRKLQKI